MSGSAAQPLDDLQASIGEEGADRRPWARLKATERVPGLSDEEAGAVPVHLWDRALFGPLDELLRRPGKAFRARMVRLGWSLADAEGAPPPALADIVELLHAASLIIDDIQDGAWQRRGGPALHRIHGVPVSLNAANWLYFWPFRLLEQLALAPEMERTLQRRMHHVILRCHHGQALDLGVCILQLPARDVMPVVETATRLKTGSLIDLAVTLGAQVGGAGAPRLQALSVAAQELGIALQMLDDLGALSSMKRRHKAYEDLVAGRPTWPWAWLSERPAVFADLQVRGGRIAHDARHPEALADALRGEVEAQGRRRIRQRLDAVMHGFRRAVGHHAALQDLAGELERLEESYG